MKNFTIDAADEGTRLNRWLQKQVPSLPGTLMYRYLREKKIKLNGKRCESSSRLTAGDLLELYIDDEFFLQPKRAPDFMRASSALDIVYEDTNIAALRKPAGLLVHADKEEYVDTLVSRFLRKLYERGEYDPADGAAFTPAVCNRLDRGTDGIVLAGKSAIAVRELGEMIKRRVIDKRYLCVCSGKIPADGRYRAFLQKNERSNTVSVFETQVSDSKEIVTDFKTLERKDGLALVEAGLITGRPHQIRAHLAHLGAPIAGDSKYGNDTLNRTLGERSQLLCAYKILFNLDDESLTGPLGYLDGKIITLREVAFARRYFGAVNLP